MNNNHYHHDPNHGNNRQIVFLGPGALPENMQLLPAHLQVELIVQEQSATDALYQLLDTYRFPMSAELVQLAEDLFVTMRRHLNRQVDDYSRYEFQGVMPELFWADLRRGEQAFVVNRAAVFQGAENQFEAERFRPGLSEPVITARRQLLVLVHDLAIDLHNRPFVEAWEVAEEEMDLDDVIRHKEETMMAAAASFLLTFQEMSLAVVRHIESGFVNGH